MLQLIQEMVVGILVTLMAFVSGLIGILPDEVVGMLPPEVTQWGEMSSEGGAGVASSTVAMVLTVIDGDTIEVAGGQRVRLLGIDTPEIGECYYQEAKDFLRSKIDGREVVLESDITDTDKYGRLLRHVLVETDTGREHVNYQLVEQGFAEVLPIPPDRAYRPEFKAAETAAKNEGRGRFGGCYE